MNSTRLRSPDQQLRNGFTLMECIVAVGLLTAFTVSAGPLLLRIQDARTELNRQQYAMTELRNLMESGVATGHFPDQISDEALAQLPDAELTREISPLEEEQNGQRVTLSLRWTTVSGSRSNPLELHYWIFRESNNTAQPPRSEEDE